MSQGVLLERVDLELPCVTVGVRGAVEEFAELFGEVVSGELPGVGIMSRDDKRLRTRARHVEHQAFVMKAIALLEGQVEVVSDFTTPDTNSVPAESGGFTHVDDEQVRMMSNEERRLQLRMRLHTADVNNGCNVLFFNSHAASFAPYGDENLYLPGGKLADGNENGYDENIESRPYGGAHWAAEEGQNTALAVEGGLHYHFKERPGLSVLFRSQSAFGPVTGHSFTSMDDTRRRVSYFSNLRLGSMLNDLADTIEA